MAKLTVPIVIDWDDIKDHLEQHDIVKIVRCKKCMMKRICRYKTGLGDNGFCSQGKEEIVNEKSE